MSSVETLEVTPDIARICEGLRDTGYDLNMAVADIVDNSITAGATLIDVRVSMSEDGQLAFSIGDNGHGMDREGLINAMRYGSAPDGKSGGLSKFGLGLKTASTAFCRKLAVCSRPSADAEALTAVWDLDVMSQLQSWALELAPAGELELELLNACASDSSGTVVIWDRVDRMMTRFSGKTGEAAQAILTRMMEALYEHLATVFQRFLDPGDPRARTLALRLNGKPVRPWDPFCVEELGGSDEIYYLNAQIGEENVPIVVEAYILPREEAFKSEEARQRARLTTENQGIYVYRENRLIHGPNWLGLYPQEPHFSLLRISLSFDYRLDEAFMVDIKKSRILINDQLYAWLKDTFLPKHMADAESRYRKGAAAKAAVDSAHLHHCSDTGLAQHWQSLSIPAVDSIDGEDVLITNKHGAVLARPRIIQDPQNPDLRIALVPTLPENALWQPALVNGHMGIVLSTEHPFYRKTYLTHATDSPLVQALDYLLWSVAQGEMNELTDENTNTFTNMRNNISANVAHLMSLLPEPQE